MTKVATHVNRNHAFLERARVSGVY